MAMLAISTRAVHRCAASRPMSLPAGVEPAGVASPTAAVVGVAVSSAIWVMTFSCPATLWPEVIRPDLGQEEHPNWRLRVAKAARLGSARSFAVDRSLTAAPATV